MKSERKVSGHRYDFCTRLYQLMNETNTSQQTLAKAVGVTRQVIGRYMDGIYLPKIDMLAKMAEFFGVSTDYLMGMAPIKSPEIDDIAINKKLGLSQTAIWTLEYYNCFTVRQGIIPIVNFLLEQQAPSPMFTVPQNADLTEDERRAGRSWLVNIFNAGAETWEKGGYCPILTRLQQYLSLKVELNDELKITMAGTVGTDKGYAKKDMTHFEDLFEVARYKRQDLFERILLDEIRDMLRDLKPKWPDEPDSLKDQQTDLPIDQIADQEE